MRHLWLAWCAMIIVASATALTTTQASAHPPEQDNRPELPNEQTFGTPHFLVHYTTTGVETIDPTDSDGDGVPDYVELIGETMEHSWTTQINLMGWPMPPGDAGEGGDERIDVYLEDILSEGYAGYVDTNDGFLGDNPNTPEQEHRAAYAYLVLDNDYAETEEGETPIGLMRATVAHEFNHILQAGIDDRDIHFWLYEATATWMEDEIYTEVNDGVYYLDSVFKNPDICLVAEVARGDDLHWYGTWLLLRHMTERYGQDVVRVVWEQMRQLNGFRAIDAALASFGSTLEAETQSFAVANLLRAYTEGSLYPTVRIEGEIDVGTYTPVNGVQSLGVDYLHFAGSGLISVTLAAAEGPLGIHAVGIRGNEADLVSPASNTLIIDLNAYSEAYLIVHNNERIASEDECVFASYTLTVAQADTAPTPVTAIWPADRFVSPLGSGISATGGGSAPYRPPDEPYAGGNGGYATSPVDLQMSFETLIPQVLPAGYQFDYAYIMTESEFGSSAPYYVPGGGDTANFDYLDAEGNWLSITESPSPYDILQEWLDDTNYEAAGSLRMIDGVEVLVEDLSEEGDPWFSATLILRGLFIVVDSDHDEQAVVTLVQGLIAAASTTEGDQPQVLPTAIPATPPDAARSSTEMEAAGQNDVALLMSSLLLGTCGLGLCFVGVFLPLGILTLILLRRMRER